MNSDTTYLRTRSARRRAPGKGGASGRRHTMRHPGSLVLLALLLAGPTGAFAEDGDVAAGKKLYEERNCNACHTLAGVSGPMAQLGGPLDDVGSKRDAEWLRKYLTDPKAALPDAKMPKVPLDDKEMADMIAFMLSLKAGSGQ